MTMEDLIIGIGSPSGVHVLGPYGTLETRGSPPTGTGEHPKLSPSPTEAPARGKDGRSFRSLLLTIPIATPSLFRSLPYRTALGGKTPATEVTENTEGEALSHLKAPRLKSRSSHRWQREESLCEL